MEVKLTLRLNDQVIERAKTYAKNHQVSLSKMVETYLDHITKDKDQKTAITPFVESLSGVIRLPEDFDYKKAKQEYLAEKYQ
jgi:hypothetical protein